MNVEFSLARKILVFGPARSGTTVVANALNIDQECFILLEGDMFRQGYQKDFRRMFNQRKLVEGTLLSVKGSYLPGAIGSPHANEVMTALSGHYRRVGEKIALGPGRPENALLLEYIGQHHLDSDIVLTFRDPLSTLDSQHKMFPDIALSELVRSWIEAVILQLTLATHFKRVHAIFHHQLSSDLLTHLGDRLHLNVKIPAEAVGLKYVNTHAKSLGKRWQKLSTTIQSCQAVYKHLASRYDPSDLRVIDLETYFNAYQNPAQDLYKLLLEIDPNWSILDHENSERKLLIQLRGLADAGELGTKMAYDTAVQLVTLNFDNAEGACLFALAALAQGKLDEAEMGFKRAMDAGHPPFWVRYHRLALLLECNKIDEAINEISELKRLKSGDFDLGPAEAMVAAAQGRLRT